MSAIRYTAVRSLISGHTVGGLYTFTLSMAELDRQPEADANTAKSMSGDHYGLVIRHAVRWRCESGPVQGVTADQVREFLDSVVGAIRFSFAPYDSAATPSPRWRNAVLVNSRYTERRVAKRPGGGESDYFTFAFTVEEVP